MTPCYYCEADDTACKICIHSDTYIDPQEEITKLRETIAAQAAVIESLKSTLEQLWNGCENLHDNAHDAYDRGYTRAMADSCQEALTIPTDSTQILAEVRKQEREKVIEKCVELGAIERDGVFAEEIRAME